MTCVRFADMLFDLAFVEPRIYDMCEEHTVTTSHGYLSTPNYPDANYTANQFCRCRLQTTDKGMLLQVKRIPG